MSTNDRIRVCVIHPDPVTAVGLSAAFARYVDLQVDEAEGRGNASAASHRWSGQAVPDVVVADYENGLAVLEEASRGQYARVTPRVMILAAADREWEIRRALARGVHGYVLVGCTLDDLAAGVRAVHRGERHLSPQIAARLAESMSVEALTAREEEVLRLVVTGLCNKAIGKRLDIAVGTVKSHLKSAFDKLHVQSRTQAVAAVERRGVLRVLPPSPSSTRSIRGLPSGWSPAPIDHDRARREGQGFAAQSHRYGIAREELGAGVAA